MAAVAVERRVAVAVAVARRRLSPLHLRLPPHQLEEAEGELRDGRGASRASTTSSRAPWQVVAVDPRAAVVAAAVVGAPQVAVAVVERQAAPRRRAGATS